MALAAASRCIAPVQAADLVLQSLRDLAESVVQAHEFNPQLQGLSVLRNNYAPRATLDRIYDQALAEGYAEVLLKTIIPPRALIRLASGAQQSIFTYRGSDDAAVREAFLKFAEELLILDGVPA
jgi:cellulose biosynthesis protein BcsQ